LLPKEFHVWTEDFKGTSAVVENEVAIAIGTSGPNPSESDSGFHGLFGLPQFESAEPRPNPGPGQPERDRNNCHHQNDFDKSETCTALHVFKDAGDRKKDETFSCRFAP
jgi:hypothetical protein